MTSFLLIEQTPAVLNSVPIASAIVQRFCDGLVERFAWVGEMLSAEELHDWLHQECRGLNALFLGGDTELPEAFVRTSWNTPNRLGHAVRLATAIEGDDETAVFDACFMFAVDAIVTADKMSSEEFGEWSWRLDAFVETLTANLLGHRDNLDLMYVAVVDDAPVTLADFEAYFAVGDASQ